jgi:predicted RNase H-like HicB family nuclease
MDTYVVELQPMETGGFTLTIPRLPGLLILAQTADEVLERARGAIQFHSGAGGGEPHRVVRVELAPGCAGRLLKTTEDLTAA